MPIIENVTTQSAKQVWQSQDKQRTIWKLTMLINGTEPWQVETYSADIAMPGWVGDVESYDKPSNNPAYPPQTFVRQAPKEDGVQTVSPQPASAYTPKTKAPSFDKDPKSYYYAYAKDLVVALVNTDGFTIDKLTDLVAGVIVAGEQLYIASSNQQTPISVDTVADTPVSQGDIEDLISQAAKEVH